MRIFNYQKNYWKYTKVVVNGPKVISSYQNKTENRRKNKLTLRNEILCILLKLFICQGLIVTVTHEFLRHIYPKVFW